MIKNAILLAGGEGTRLFPLTQAINKSLININGKAVIDYPLATLKQMGVQNVAITLGGSHHNQIINYLQDGERYGMNFEYFFQGAAKGISQAINVAKRSVIDQNQFVVCLGDNIFDKPITWSEQNKSAQIVLYPHHELKRFGVASLTENKIIKIEEKPKFIDSKYKNYAITGCYLFDQQFFDFFKESKPSARGEFEITEIIDKYNKNNNLGFTFTKSLWADAGTYESINYLNNYFYSTSLG